MTRLPGAIFQQDNARHHTARVSNDCYRTVTTLPCPGQCPDLSPIDHIGDHLGCVCAYHSTPFIAELSVRKRSIAWSTLDAEPQTSPPPMAR
ncbi:transposable element Tcb1 transposase [Trichonephila clavipes]|nr:transposable element Tcb1 transposase [Trichonephila clavipes]